MATVPNQKTITTKGAKHDKENIYAKLNIEAMQVAMALLKPNAFKLWCYMAKNQNDYTFELSCVDACSFCKISRSSYLDSVEQLIEAGYLVKTQGNHYNFFEALPKEEMIEVTVKKSDSGFSF